MSIDTCRSAFIGILGAIAIWANPAFAQTRDLYISPSGSDTAKGTADAPLATLERARDEARSRIAPGSGVTVWLQGGVYPIQETFALTAEDSGKDGAPTVYQACPGQEVRLVGGKEIPADAFKKAEDARLAPESAEHVLVADLKNLGIEDYGTIPTAFRGAAPIAELFFSDKRMTLARWPNQEWTTVEKIIEKGSVPRSGDKDRKPGTIQYAGDRPSRWKTPEDVWLHGYWCFDWYDEAIRIKSIDTEKHQITFAAPHFYGIRQGNPPPRRWYAMNVLEELDSPGEYYIDRNQGTLFFWPPASLEEGRVILSTLKTPIVSIEDASHVILRGLILECCQGDALVMTGGSANRIEACTVCNTGATGIVVDGGDHHTVEACDIHDTGTLGLKLAGGDRKKLLPAGHIAFNNHVYRFGIRQRTYASGIHVYGVGNTVSHNLLHDAPHQAIGLGGNDHVIEYNIIHHVCMETDDCGAFYKGRNPSNRGNMIRYNFWHHIGSPRGHGNNAVYFDDGDGGDTVFGNVFFRCGEPAKGSMGAVFSHGGHDLTIENNIFVECKRAIGASPWNNKRWKSSLKGKTYQTRLLEEVDITKPPFTTRYPELVGFMDYKDEPRRSFVRRNLSVMCGEFVYGNYDEEDNWITGRDPGFADLNKGDFTLKPHSKAYRKIPGFSPIPFHKIGLVQNGLRPVVVREEWTYAPAKQLPHPRPEKKKQAARKPAPKKGPPPVLESAKITEQPEIDGVLGTDEWPGKPVTLGMDLYGYAAKPTSKAFVRHDGESLWIAVDNAVPKGSQLNQHQWGKDAVEISIRRHKPAKDEPIQVLRGYADGHSSVGSAASHEDNVKNHSAGNVKYAASICDEARWICEWQIPLKDLGYDPAMEREFAFNITVRKAANNLWLMWEGTRGHSYHVDAAGILRLCP